MREIKFSKTDKRIIKDLEFAFKEGFYAAFEIMGKKPDRIMKASLKEGIELTKKQFGLKNDR